MNSYPNSYEPSASNSIAVRAHELWQQAGSPDGRDMEFWLAAEREVQRPTGGMTGGISDGGLEALQSPNGIPIPGKMEPTDALRDTPVTGGQTGQSSATSL